MGSVMCSGVDQEDLTDKLLEAGYMYSSEVARVFRAVDRAGFIPAEYASVAYRDMAWRLNDLHISAPCIYAVVLEYMDLKPGLSFLNVGSGTGYLSTLVGFLIGPFGVNHGVECVPSNVEYAQKQVEAFKMTSGFDVERFCDPQFVCGNAFHIDSNRKYDRIYVGSACSLRDSAFFRKLLKIGGILILPCNDELLKITRTSEKTYDVQDILSVSFANIQFPEEAGSVTFPPVNPLSLQEICRSKIRSTMRVAAEPSRESRKRRRSASDEENVDSATQEKLDRRAKIGAKKVQLKNAREAALRSGAKKRMVVPTPVNDHGYGTDDEDLFCVPDMDDYFPAVADTMLPRGWRGTRYCRLQIERYIKSLPVPAPIAAYLNYDRPFLE